MGLFKRAAVRGIATELVRNGICLFPTKEAMDAAADAVADKMPPAAEGAPPAGLGAETSGPEGHDPNEVAAVATKLIEIAQQLMAEAGGGAPPGGEGGAPGAPPAPPGPEAAAAKLGAEQFAKVAASYDYRDLAVNAAELLMQKAAEETKVANPQGALLHGGDKENTPGAAAKNDSVAALDEKQRPQGKYHEGMGNTTLESRKGHVGELEQNPTQPHNSPAGSNSLTKDEHKSAALDAQISKIAEKLIMHGGAHKNTPEAAAKNDGIAALDQKQRPQGKYLVGMGNANIKEDAAARIGKEQPNPVQPGNSPGGTNSVISASKTGSELTDAEKFYVAAFSKTAEDVGPYLPEKMAQENKVAAIKHMMDLDHDGRQAFITGLHKTGGDISEAMKHLEHKHEEKKADHECKGEKCEHESHKDGKKEGGLMGTISDIASKYTKPAPAA